MFPPEQLGGSHEVVVRRRLPAPREVLYALWLDAETMPSWVLDGGTRHVDGDVRAVNGRRPPRHGAAGGVVVSAYRIAQRFSQYDTFTRKRSSAR